MASASDVTRLEQLLKHDRSIVIGSVVVLVCLAWLYTLAGTGMAMNAFDMTRDAGGDV